MTLQEFAASYVGTALLALAFLALGALLAPQPGTSLPNSAAAFDDAVVDLYASALGGWSVPLVGVSACCAMVGTLLTMLDGYARTLVRAAVLCFDWQPKERALSGSSVRRDAVRGRCGGLRAARRVPAACTASSIWRPRCPSDGEPRRRRRQLAPRNAVRLPGVRTTAAMAPMHSRCGHAVPRGRVVALVIVGRVAR